MKRVLCVLGTRPEAIKLAPVIRELRRRDGIITKICSTGQHDRVLYDALAACGIEPIHYQRAVLLPGASLDVLASRLLVALNVVMNDLRPDLVVVQGDTTTALCGALSAFHHDCAVAHVEAGLRTSNAFSPFPEEMNRRLISRIARLHFCPTRRAYDTLNAEPHNGETYLTGNTIVDELKRALADSVALAAAHRTLWREGISRAYVLVTCHRRERLSERLDRLCAAVTEIAKRGVAVLWPTHPNPAIAVAIEKRLAVPYVHVTPPLSYVEFLTAIRFADAVITDSGGAIEESVTFGTPLFIIRDETERPEALNAGGRLVSMSEMNALPQMIEEAGLRARPDDLNETFGDGLAGERIASIIERWMTSS